MEDILLVLGVAVVTRSTLRVRLHVDQRAKGPGALLVAHRGGERALVDVLLLVDAGPIAAILAVLRVTVGTVNVAVRLLVLSMFPRHKSLIKLSQTSKYNSLKPSLDIWEAPLKWKTYVCSVVCEILMDKQKHYNRMYFKIQLFNLI